VKDEELIGKKMGETILDEGKSIVLEKVRLYVQSMALHLATMTTAPAASKAAVVVEKNN